MPWLGTLSRFVLRSGPGLTNTRVMSSAHMLLFLCNRVVLVRQTDKKKEEKVEERVTLGPKVAEGENVFGVAHIFASFNDTFVVSVHSFGNGPVVLRSAIGTGSCIVCAPGDDVTSVPVFSVAGPTRATSGGVSLTSG